MPGILISVGNEATFIQLLPIFHKTDFIKKQLVNFLLLTVAGAVVFTISSCSKSSPGVAPVTPTDFCAGKTIVITPVITDANACGGNGRIKVSASGSSGFTYKLNSGGTYQADDSFGNVAAGSYTVFAKDKDGCEKSVAVTVSSTGAAGPLFTAVKNLLAAKCQACHNNSVQNGGMNWEQECNIVTHKSRIKERAVDLGTMPQSGPLSLAEKNIISNWIAAGGGFAN